MTDNSLGFEHGASAYRNHLCRCPICKASHNEECKAYAKAARANTRAMKLELARLRAFEARVLSAVSQDTEVTS